MSFWNKLFGTSSAEPTPEVYKECRIFPTLKKGSDGYRVSARIEKVFEDQTKVHTLIRADVIRSEEDALAATLAKAKQVIDEQGDGLFASR